MPDMEKVIKGIEHCKKYGSLGGNDCNGYYEYTDNLQEIIKANNHRKDCPYGQCRTGCVVTLIADTLALLKGQEAIQMKISEDYGIIKFGECPKCKSLINNRYYPKSCGCGQAVKWE